MKQQHVYEKFVENFSHVFFFHNCNGYAHVVELIVEISVLNCSIDPRKK